MMPEIGFGLPGEGEGFEVVEVVSSGVIFEEFHGSLFN